MTEKKKNHIRKFISFHFSNVRKVQRSYSNFLNRHIFLLISPFTAPDWLNNHFNHKTQPMTSDSGIRLFMSKTGPCSTCVNILSMYVQWRTLCIKQTSPFPVLINHGCSQKNRKHNPKQRSPRLQTHKTVFKLSGKRKRSWKNLKKNHCQTDQHKI